MKYLILVSCFFLSFTVSAEEASSSAPTVFDTLLGTSYNSWLDTTLERVAAWVILGYIQFKIWALSFAFDVASLVVSSLNITQDIDTYLQSMDATLYNWVVYLRVIDGINLLLSSYGASMIMRMF